MFIKAITTEGRVMTNQYGLQMPKHTKRVLNVGKFKDIGITVDQFYNDGKLTEKRYVFWTDQWQKVYNKVLNKHTGKFERA